MDEHRVGLIPILRVVWAKRGHRRALDGLPLYALAFAGAYILQLGANGSYDAMYAVVLTVAFLGFAADRGYQMLMNRMLQWREQTP